MDEYIEREALMKNFCGYDLTKCVKYGNKDANQQHDSYSTMMMYEIASEIEDAPAADVAPVRRWIPVTERLPETGGYVVCIAKRNPFSRFMPMVARIEKNGWVNPITEQYISDVTLWMPLPSTEGLK